MTDGSFDRRQYVLLLQLLRTLGSRRELTSQFGMHGPALGMLAGLGFLMGGFIALLILSGQIPARDVLIICQTLTALVLVPLLVSEAADALLNPAEASVLAHRPVGNLTYLAAKVTYLLGFALAIAGAFNLLPAVAGVRLEGVAWFYPLTHLAAASLGAVFTALATCGVFGILFRFIPVTRVRSAALWVQLAGGVAVPLLPPLARLVKVRPDFDAPFWSAIPVTWFAALGLAGQTGGQPLHLSLALPAMLVSAGLVAMGFRVLSQNYMTRVSTVLRSRPGPGTRRGGRWLFAVLRWLTGSRQGAGSGLFVLRMATRDWQFRRAALRGAVPILMMLLFGAQRGLRSPFAEGPGFTMAHFLPHIIGLTLMTASDFLPFSDHYKARWIFLTMPASGMRGVVHGTVAALWLVGAALPSGVLFVATSYVWGIAAAGLFAMYSLTVLSFYLGAFVWLQSGLPFTRPPDPTRAAGNMAIMVGVLIVALILGAVQAIWVFPHPMRVLVASAALAAAAWPAARASMRSLEGRTRDHLDAFTEGPARMFALSTDQDARR